MSRTGETEKGSYIEKDAILLIGKGFRSNIGNIS